MKAQVALCVIILILGSVASHTVSKRSLLRGGNHHNHHQHNNRRLGGRRQNRRRFGARRRGRDGDHHEENHHDDHHHEEARAISTGYLPAEEDYSYEDDLPGYGGANTRDNLPGYGGDSDDQSQYGDGADTRDLGTYEDADATTTVAPDFKDYTEEEEASGDTADDQYGAPSDINNDYAEPNGDYGAPEGSGADETGVDVARNTDYSAPGQEPDSGYGGPGQDSAPSYDSQNGFPFDAVEQRSQGRAGGPGGPGGDRQCPGGSIEECVSVCPGSSVRVYGACVGGCADRCPESKK